MAVERADRTIVVPDKARRENWTADQAQEWARNDVLAGGPPDAPTDPATGEVIRWNKIKDWAGKRVRIRARPMGLIVTNQDGTKKFFPGDATSGAGGRGFAVGATTKQMREQAAVESSIRKFAMDEIRRYNKQTTAGVRESEHRTAAREFWCSGKRIRDFIATTPHVNQDGVWYSLEQWGRGESGYGKNWLEYATYFYDWKPNAQADDPVFGLSETRVMNILRATKDGARREALLRACLKGPFSDFSDEEFKWITGQSKGTFPLSPELFEEFNSFGSKVADGQTLLNADTVRIQEITALLDQAPRKTPSAQEEPTSDE